MKIYLLQKNKAFTRTPKFGVTPKGGGFTLVETLVAISIFTMSILALMSVLASGISDTTYAKKKITAEYLAQEGIEYIRNMRDTYVLYPENNTTWESFNSALSDASCFSGNGCYFDDRGLNACGPVVEVAEASSLLALTIIDLSSCPVLLYDDTTGYGYNNGGANSGFIRKIQITSGSSADEIKISSTVSWEQGSGNYGITFSENLFNWTE